MEVVEFLRIVLGIIYRLLALYVTVGAFLYLIAKTVIWILKTLRKD